MDVEATKDLVIGSWAGRGAGGGGGVGGRVQFWFWFLLVWSLLHQRSINNCENMSLNWSSGLQPQKESGTG